MGLARVAKGMIWALQRSSRREAGRILIVNADDFGMSESVNRGIGQAHEQGIVTSASLMVREPAAEAAVDFARSHPNLSLGIHVDIGCWDYRDGDWVERYHVVPTDDAEAVRREVHRQLVRFRELTGEDPTHLDSHQHAHRDEPARSVLLEAARELAVPLRSFTPGVGYCGSYYGQSARGDSDHDAITVESLMRILVTLPPGITELACHPAIDTDVGDPVYRLERERELEALCDPRIRKLLAQEGIQTRSFHDAASSWWEH